MSVEPSFLAQVYAGQVDPADKEMVRLLKCGHSTDAQFMFRTTAGFNLLYHVLCTSLQLVLPGSRRLHNLMMHELHCTSTATQLGAQKVIWALSQRVWWPHLAQHITSFVHHCDTCQRVKGRTSAPSGSLQPLPIP